MPRRKNHRKRIGPLTELLGADMRVRASEPGAGEVAETGGAFADLCLEQLPGEFEAALQTLGLVT